MFARGYFTFYAAALIAGLSEGSFFSRDFFSFWILDCFPCQIRLGPIRLGPIRTSPASRVPVLLWVLRLSRVWVLARLGALSF